MQNEIIAWADQRFGILADPDTNFYPRQNVLNLI